MSGNIQAPMAISGVVTKLPEISVCMDGATHLIHTSTGATRLKGLDARVSAALAKVADGKRLIMVTGYMVWGPECMSLSVYHVAAVTDVNSTLAGDDLFPWPWA
jgi:hypothetical protein